jgi:hypothetical protein
MAQATARRDTLANEAEALIEKLSFDNGTS